jgi:hypothetical protein
MFKGKGGRGGEVVAVPATDQWSVCGGLWATRGSEILREVAWVIFDEIHYMQDKERGVVWEETIIFMPPEAKMVSPHPLTSFGGAAGQRAVPPAYYHPDSWSDGRWRKQHGSVGRAQLPWGFG